MKRLYEQVSLVGKIETITMTELRTRPGEVMDQVFLGKVFLIKRANRFMAVLSKVPGENLAIKVHKDGRIEYTL